MRTALIAALTVLAQSLTMIAQAEKLRVIGFNVEAGWKHDTDQETVAS